jgi:Fuc2NAc and GlcNAc transferase
MVVLTLLMLPVLTVFGGLPLRGAIGLFGAGSLVAAIGFADDHGHIQPRWRLLVHFFAAGWLVVWLGGLPPLSVPGGVMEFGWVGYPIAVLYVVWLLNLCNFMDGIDGIAATEVATVALGGAAIRAATTSDIRALSAPLVVAGAALGFLIWNWPPARIFMGDVGSGFLGLVVAALSLEAGWVQPHLLWSWIMLLGVFIVDATVTLIRRAVRGDRFYEAHRSHAYQHAAARLGSHLPVTVATAAITIGWLLPLALLVAAGVLQGVLGVAIAYIPLVAAALWLKAGLPTG